jgi:hypothetical protein
MLTALSHVGVLDLGDRTIPFDVINDNSHARVFRGLHGRPRDFQVIVQNTQVSAGAGFLVILTGDILWMPGLPRQPKAEQIELLADGSVESFPDISLFRFREEIIYLTHGASDMPAYVLRWIEYRMRSINFPQFSQADFPVPE